MAKKTVVEMVVRKVDRLDELLALMWAVSMVGKKDARTVAAMAY